jgi:hypothetical protein
MKKLRNAVLALVAATILTLAVASPASASDWGGYANPGASGCGSNYVVASKPITGRAGLVGAYLEIKWSNGCPGNYARIVMANGHSGDIALSIHSQVSPYNAAGTDETNVSSSAWTYVIALAHSSDAVCAYADIRFFYQFPWEAPVSAVLCA